MSGTSKRAVSPKRYPRRQSRHPQAHVPAVKRALRQAARKPVRTEFVALVVLYATTVVGALVIGPFTGDPAPTWPYFLLIPGSIGLGGLTTLGVLLERRHGSRYALARAIHGDGDHGIGASIAIGILIGASVGGQRLELTLPTLALVIALGFGPGIVWRRTAERTFKEFSAEHGLDGGQ